MSFGARVGETFLMPHPGGDREHMWVVISEKGNEVVIVNFNSRKRWSDETVILASEDHPYINRSTVVTYADARRVSKEKLIELFQQGERELTGSAKLLSPHADCSAKLLRKIKEGVNESEFTPLEIKEFCEIVEISNNANEGTK